MILLSSQLLTQGLLIIIQVTKVNLFSHQHMDQMNQSNFIDLSYSTTSISYANLPLYVVYLDSNLTSNIDYLNIFQLNDVNNGIFPTKQLCQQENTQNIVKNVSKGQVAYFRSPKINASQNYQQASGFNNSKKSTKIKSKAKSNINYSQDEDYSPNESSEFQLRVYKLSQSKNIPKNYQKAILLFINKNIAYTYKVLHHCNVNFQDFMKYYRQINTGLGSMAKLRSLWIDSQNPFARVFRIISKEYLRKHSLSYIFNSRVVNISKHIKYRQIIQESIGNPQSFTHLKQY